ncbi:adenylate/guanylate cyclase domain-containing protein [Planococcus salinarum]|uniref:adenylate/guanylate cyclase domain-containing protein n=1 Tax=Planococcus salinarum TaxID=622695 RepID=UPI000E3B9DAE|nr:adenylate/guanylate cyclase domain-containing protein [Planococcus salinarum]TAA72244.1 adenylate/guanylate cyclase domain-containing protein [Planococcus salinarum]
MDFAPKVFVMERSYELSKEEVWGLLADNDRMNQYIGLFPVSFSTVKKDGQGIFYREANATAAGVIPMVWQELPFQWEEFRNYRIERRYIKGPLKYYTWHIEFLDTSKTAEANQTTVRLTAEFTPKNLVGLMSIYAVAVKSMKKALDYLDDYLKSGAQKLHEAPQKNARHKIDLAELERLETVLRNWPVEEEQIGLLHQYLTEKSDHDAALMEPFKIAEQWGADPDAVLRLFLYATKSGILNLSWNLICPNCRVSKSANTSLSGLTADFHCDLCGINYDASFDQFVELHFSVHPAIRKAYAEVYCVGAPIITPHVKVQKIIERGMSARFPVPETEGNWRLRVLQSNEMVYVERAGAESETAIGFTDGGWSESRLLPVSELMVHNSSGRDIVAVLEQADWSKNAVTAAQVTAMQEFRDLFSSEVLSPGQQIGIDHVTILFTDLQGSTSLYETVGDANAYGQVNKHFDFLSLWIGKNSGSVVKTIGDAVMAVFHLPEDGLRAALEIQQHVAEFNKDKKDPIVLKVGLHSGPAIAVTSNDRLDYFGRTVNLAARIQGQGLGGDIIFSRDYLDQPKLRALVEQDGVKMEAFPAKLKGIQGEVELVRACVGDGVIAEAISPYAFN